MTDEPDKNSKTEQPTEKKLSDAREKGNVPFSRELTNFASLCAMVIVGYLYLPAMAKDMALALSGVFANINQWPLQTAGDLAGLRNQLGLKVLVLLAPVILPLLAFGLIASLAQNTPRLLANRIIPKAERVSPAKGLKRMVGRQGFREFCKALFKFSAAGLVAGLVGLAEFEFVLSRHLAAASTIPAAVHGLYLQVLAALTATAAILGTADLIWTRRDWFDDLKMTRQEIKDELKQSEGDPMVRLRARSVAQDRARRRMIAQTANATLVVANPHHFAVAMRYDRNTDAAPRVLAKGQDHVALKIRAVAEENDIPVAEDPPLARALYQKVEVDMEIPVEFYIPLARDHPRPVGQ